MTQNDPGQTQKANPMHRLQIGIIAHWGRHRKESLDVVVHGEAEKDLFVEFW